MANYGDLFDKLAEAYARPSGAYRAASAAIDVPNQGIEGYLQGTKAGDEIKKSKMGRRLLGDVLGQGLEGATINEADALAKPLSAYADYKKATGSGNDWLTKFNMQQDAIGKRQKDRQEFIKSMVGAKGNKDAVAEAQDALKASEAMQSLNDELDTLSPTMARLNSTSASKILEPKIAAKKANILLYAGFSRGGKQLTGTELGVVVDALTPTGFDNLESRHLKNKTFQDWAQGKIGLLDAAKLLGPAGLPLMKIAQDQRVKQENDQKQMVTGLVNDESDPYAALGIPNE